MRPPISKQNAPSFRHAVYMCVCVRAAEVLFLAHQQRRAAAHKCRSAFCVCAFVVKVVTQRSLTDCAADANCATSSLFSISDAYSLVSAATRWFIYYLRSYLYG